MNLRDLDYLVAVADLRSFGQAAKKCHISQPTLSMQIKKMEDTLGVQMFERVKKTVLLTPVGEAIVISARRILQETQIIKELADTARQPLAGTLKLGAFPTLSPYLFPAFVGLIRQSLPQIRLILIEEKTDELLARLLNGSLDAALLALPIEDDCLDLVELFEDAFLLAVPSEHSLAGRECIHSSELAGQRLMLLEEGHCLRGQALQVCQIYQAGEREDVSGTGLETLRQMVRAGTGITFMPSIAVRNSDPGICYLPFSEPTPQRTIALVWRKTSPRRILFAELIPLLKQSARGGQV